ncbi:MAG: hypothetical protein DHS20C16_09160 [Phycisphaerae bacterium]|nr:MAG: hypothetical protein DHS20C16_09160 [Phycisphaerae bacterium]
MDINTDGVVDMVMISDVSGSPSNLVVYLGLGSGVFDSPVSTIAGGTSLWALETVDVNKDDIPDTVIAARESNSVVVRLGVGDGTFNSPSSYSVDAGPQDVTVCDIDNDGDQDILSASVFAGTVNVLRGDGNGAFASSEVAGAAPGAEAVTCFDIDRDGFLDIIAASGNNAVIIRANGQGGFHPPETFASNASDLVDVSIAQLNDDCAADIALVALGSNNVSVLRNGGPPFSLDDDITYGSGSSIGRMTVAPIGTSGLPDVVAVDIGNGDAEMYRFLNDGAGNLTTSSSPVSGCSQIGGVHNADIDSDGDLDILLICSINAALFVYENNGDGSLLPPVIVPGGGRRHLTTCDLDGDFDIDVVAGDDTDDVLYWYENDGSGTFSGPFHFANVGTPLELACKDFDFDGDFDVAVSKASGTDGVYVFLNDGSGSFTETFLATENGGVGLAVCDVDGDLLPDIMQANDDGISVIINAGGGTFLPSVSTNDTGRDRVECCDFDGDGDNDLLVDHSTGRLAAYLNNGSGQFQFAPAVYQMGGVVDIACVDMDGNGSLDILTSNVVVHRRDNLIAPGLSLLSSPTANTVRVGDPVELSVTVSNPNDISYQWYKDASPIASQSDSVLILPSVNEDERGYYSVLASNECSDITTEPVYLRILSRADLDSDGDLDTDDLSRFVDCLLGPDIDTPNASCSFSGFSDADFDGDGHVDLLDFRLLQSLYVNP